MTAKQKKQVIRILKADCQIEYAYIDGSGETCAIGALALAAKVPKSTLRSVNGIGISYEGEGMPLIRRKISKKFGLDDSDMRSIQLVNDSGFSTVNDRRAAVLKRVRAMEVDE